MQVLFVHGMGRSPLSDFPLLFHLKKSGLNTSTFGYMASLHSFESIQHELANHITYMAAQGDYILVGHSLGGVLIRAALSIIAQQHAKT